jgi:ATP-dependent helicase/nuclease subunit B
MPIGNRATIKSRGNGRLLDAAAEFLSSQVEAVIIAPTHSAGEDAAHRTLRSGGPGFSGIHRLTIVQLAADVARPALARLGLAPLTTLGMEALAARVACAALKERKLAYFEPVAALPGFARSLARTLAELRMNRSSLAALAASGAPGADLAILQAGYEAELETGALADLARVYELATAAAEENHRWLGLPLVLLDVPLKTASERKFMDAVSARAPALLRCLIEEDADDPAPVSELEHIRTYLFAPSPPRAPRSGAFDFFSAPGEGLEAAEIARRIARLARAGTRFDQVAILLRDPARCQPMIEEALRRAAIPAYFSRGTARPDPGGRAFLALLACACEKFSASRFAEYLSLGQAPAADAERSAEWVPADDEMLGSEPQNTEDEPPQTDEAKVARAPAAWEKLLVDAAVIGGRERWRRRLSGLDRELELRLKTLERENDPRREHLAQRLDQLRQLEKFALPLVDLLAALPEAATWKEWIEHLSNLARAALRRPEPVIAVLAEFEPMGEVGPAPLEEIAEVLGERLRFLRRDPPQRPYGRVFVGSIDEARGREFGFVFLPGLAEGIFPQRALEDPLLLDEFRKSVDSALPLRDGRVLEERMRLRIAVAAARDGLIASYPRMDVAEARPRVPSFYALELPRAIEGRLPELKEFEQQARNSAQARLNWPAPQEPQEAIDPAEYDLVMLRKKQSARYLVEANQHLARSLRARWKRWEIPKWSNADGLITTEAEPLAALHQQRLRERAWSPSSLQQFAVCPYKFALYGIFALRPREESAPIEQMDPLTRGALFHRVQFALLGELRSAGLLPVNAQRLAAALEIADAVLDRVAAQSQEELVPAIDRVWRSEIDDLRTDLRGWLRHISVNDSDWQPIHFELAFGLAPDADRDPASVAAESDLVECGVRLRGSIDLVERHTSSEALRITDHKTGKVPETTPHLVGGGKYLQPLLYGLAAEKLLGRAVECGRLLYATHQGGYQPIEIKLDHRARLFLTKLLAHIDTAIADGFLPPVPQKDACGSCDYRVVCGPYEELRAARYKDRRDERLDALVEIRGMA